MRASRKVTTFNDKIGVLNMRGLDTQLGEEHETPRIYLGTPAAITGTSGAYRDIPQKRMKYQVFWEPEHDVARMGVTPFKAVTSGSETRLYNMGGSEIALHEYSTGFPTDEDVVNYVSMLTGINFRSFLMDEDVSPTKWKRSLRTGTVLLRTEEMRDVKRKYDGMIELVPVLGL